MKIFSIDTTHTPPGYFRPIPGSFRHSFGHGVRCGNPFGSSKTVIGANRHIAKIAVASARSAELSPKINL